jgi:hypothetical protein
MLIPFASYCVECQEKRNSARLGWGEGSTIAPYDHKWTLPDEMEEPIGCEYQSTDPEEQLTIRHGEPLASEPRSQGKHLAAKKHDPGAKDKASVTRVAGLFGSNKKTQE